MQKELHRAIFEGSAVVTDFEKLFASGEPNTEKLIQNGFIRTESGYFKESKLMDFLLRVSVTDEGKVQAELFDPEADAPYTLHLVTNAAGNFVGEVRKAYEEALLLLAETCFDKAVFKQRLTKDLLRCAEAQYGEKCEYLWERFPENGILRRADNRKWYAVIMTVAGNKVGLSTENIVEIVDLRAEEEVVNTLIHSRGFAPAWHMNKKSWITVLLDGSVEFSTIAEMLEKSRCLAAKK